MQVAADVDAASDGEQRRQQDDEGQVLGHQGMHKLGARRLRPKDDRKWQQKCQ